MVKIKICGITNRSDYRHALSLEVDYTGFIFYPPSPRYIEPETASGMVRPEGSSAARVGVFVNEDIQRVHDIHQAARLDIVQLHGEESPDYCRRLGLPFWKAIRLAGEASVAETEKYRGGVILLDSFHPGMYGGTGRMADLALVERCIALGGRFIIAGGVSGECIGDLLRLSPFGVDINSAIEKRPGVKDHLKMERLVKRIKSKEE